MDNWMIITPLTFLIAWPRLFHHWPLTFTLRPSNFLYCNLPLVSVYLIASLTSAVDLCRYYLDLKPLAAPRSYPVPTSPVSTSPVSTSPVSTSPVSTSPVSTSPVGTRNTRWPTSTFNGLHRGLHGVPADFAVHTLEDLSVSLAGGGVQ